MPQIGRSLVRSQLVPLEFFIDIKSFRSHYGPGVDSASKSKCVPGLFPGGKGGRYVSLTTLPPSCAVVMKSGNLNFLEPFGPVQACNGTDLPFLHEIWDSQSVADEDLNLLGYDTKSACEQYFRGFCCLHSRIHVVQEEKLSLEKWVYYISKRQVGRQASRTVSVCSGWEDTRGNAGKVKENWRGIGV